jgi:hypothetical protein
VRTNHIIYLSHIQYFQPYDFLSRWVKQLSLGNRMNQILQYLKTHSEPLDSEIAVGAGLSLSKTRLHLAELAAKGEIVAYRSTRFLEGQKIEGIRCRLVGITQKKAAGRKLKVSKSY